MITSCRYEYLRYENRESIKDWTVLRARLEFADEVAPKDRAGVEMRMHLTNASSVGINRYLPRQGYGLKEHTLSFFRSLDFENSSRSKRVRVSYPWFTPLALDLRVTAPGLVPFNELFDLKKLNEYILDGIK